jgi:hypothetical protein
MFEIGRFAMIECPYCKKIMIEGVTRNVFSSHDFIVCDNEKCNFYGIKRLNIKAIARRIE